MTYVLALKNIRTKLVAGLVTAGANSTDATAFVGSLGDGTILQAILAFLSNPQNIAMIEQLISFIVQLFAAGGGALTPPTT